MLNKYEEIMEADMNRTCQSRLDSIVNLMDRRIDRKSIRQNVDVFYTNLKKYELVLKVCSCIHTSTDKFWVQKVKRGHMRHDITHERKNEKVKI